MYVPLPSGDTQLLTVASRGRHMMFFGEPIALNCSAFLLLMPFMSGAPCSETQAEAIAPFLIVVPPAKARLCTTVTSTADAETPAPARRKRRRAARRFACSARASSGGF